MTCPNDDLLKLFVTGRLESAGEERIETHLASCPSCSKRLNEIEEASHDPLINDLKAVDAISETSLSETNAESASEPTAIPANIGNYQIVGILGRGGMGIVYKGVNPHLRRSVAIKVVKTSRIARKESVERFYREMAAIGKLQHPNIVQALDAGVIEGQPYLVMELLEGNDLAHFVQKNGPIPVREACDMIRQVSLGLQHAHNAGIIHRDIKPSNLWRMPDGTIKILDLGLARLQAMQPTETTGADDGVYPTHGETQEGYILGSPDYMSPEQAVNPKQVDHRTDIYSLGCTFYFLLTGKPPYPQDIYPTFHDKIQGHTLETFPAISDIPQEINLLMQKMTAKVKLQRPDTLQSIVDILGRKSHRLSTKKIFYFALAAIFLACSTIFAFANLRISKTTIPSSIEYQTSLPEKAEQEMLEKSSDISVEPDIAAQEENSFQDELPTPQPEFRNNNIISNDNNTLFTYEPKPRRQAALSTHLKSTTSGDGWSILREISVGDGTNNSAFFCPDNKSIIEGSSDGIVRVWDVETGEVTKEIKGPAFPVTALTFSWDYSKLAIAYKDATVSVRDYPSYKETFSYKSGGRYTFYEERIEKVSQRKSVAHRRTIETQDFNIYSTTLAFSYDGKKLFTLGDHPNVIDLETKHILRGHWFRDKKITEKETLLGIVPDASLFYRNDCVHVVVAGDLNLWFSLHIKPEWNTSEENSTSYVTFPMVVFGEYKGESPLNSTTCIKYDDDQELICIAAGISKAILIVRDITEPQQNPNELIVTEEKIIPYPGFVYCCAFSPDRKHLLIGGTEGDVEMWDIQAEKINRSFPMKTSGSKMTFDNSFGGNKKPNELVLALDYAPNARRFLIRSKESKTITIWHYDGEMGEISPRKSIEAIRKDELPYADRGPGKIQGITKQLEDGTYLETHKAIYYEDGSYDILEESFINDDTEPGKNERGQ